MSDNVLPLREMQRLKESMESLKKGGGSGTFDPMEARVAKLEARYESIDKRLDSVDRRLDRIEDKIPSKWDMAQVIFFVVGGLMAAAAFGPRLMALLSTTP